MLKGIKKAFTLAEVLIVVAVIGITATLVLPNLGNDVEDQKVVAALRKIYPELQSAYQAVISKYGTPAEWTVPNNSSTSEMMYNYLLKELAVSKACGKSSGCIPSDSSWDNDDYSYKMILKDGTFLAVTMESQNNIQSSLASNGGDKYKGYAGDIFVDVNGGKGDNEWGHDQFPFIIYNYDGVVPDGEHEGDIILPDTEHPTAWAIKAGNLDYLKCPSDLDWETKRTCN